MTDPIIALLFAVVFAAQVLTLSLIWNQKRSRRGRVFHPRTGGVASGRKTGRIYRRPPSKNVRVAPGDDLINPDN